MTANRTTLLVTAGALALCTALAGSNIIYAHRARQLNAQLEATRAELQARPVRPSPAVADTGLEQRLAERDAEYAQLRAEYEQLKQRLSTATTAGPGLATAATPPSAEPRRTDQPPWLERLREQDPERYRQILEAREQRRRATDEWFQNQLHTLEQRAQTAPSQEELDLLEQIADTLARIHELREKMRALRELPEPQRREAARQLNAEMRAAYGTLEQLRERDRQLQLAQLAQSIGYNDPAGIQQFVDGVQQIYKNTEYSPRRALQQLGQPEPQPPQPSQP